MRKPQLSFTSASLLAISLLASACGSSSKQDSAPTPTSLYVRMGGQTGMEGITNQLVANVGAETGITASVMLRSHKPMLDVISSQNGAPATDPTRLERLRNNVLDQFTDITGGPLKYRGKSMLLAHTNMQVTDKEYATWRELLDKTLAQKAIPAKEKAEFTALIDAMKTDVVNH